VGQVCSGLRRQTRAQDCYRHRRKHRRDGSGSGQQIQSRRHRCAKCVLRALHLTRFQQHFLGSDGGGHGLRAAQPTFTLISSILDALPPSNTVPVIAAGGLVRPNQVAAMLTLGASGTVHGTLFLATPESIYQPAAKQAIIDSDGSNSVRSFGFDLLRGTTGWPKGVDGRGLAISSIDPLEGMEQDVTPSGVDLQALRERMQDRKEQIVWAGTGVGAIKEMRAAAVRAFLVFRSAC